MNTELSLNQETLAWLLEEGAPGVRYLALRDLLDLPPDDPDLQAAAERAHTAGPIAVVLENMAGEGYWVEPGPGYSPKYSGTVWSLILLAQLGASVEFDPRIEIACRYYIEHAVTEFGQVSASGTPGGTVDCLQGNMLHTLLDLGYRDKRIGAAFEWMARTVTGEGIAPMGTKDTALRFYSGKIGPEFACGANNKLACAWGAVKVMVAFSQLPEKERTPLIERAIQRGVDFLLGVDPATADYPNGWAEKPSGNWWKFGFPVFYVTDLLQNAEALVRLGYGQDPRLANALRVIREKQDEHGRWPLEYDYAGKTWLDFGKKKQPNKWVTLRAARVLKQAGEG